MTSNIATEILIVGAGPTGLVLGLSLCAQGVPFTIIDSRGGPGEASRAMVVQARTLEYYRKLGLAQVVAAQGIPIEHVAFRNGGHNLDRVDLHDAGRALSPFPFVLAYPQDDHERFLAAQLQAGGVAIEWHTTLTALAQTATHVTATLQSPEGQTERRFHYLCGCDGAHSAVRQHLDIGFPGDTYAQVFYVADVRLASAPDRDLHINLDTRALALVLPVRSNGMQRLIGLIPTRFADREGITFEDIRHDVEHLANIDVVDVNWFSRYRVHHRVADRFRVDRCFIAGDAGHIHSPAGGQGMNTGIGDAFNLGWKLAAVVQGKASPEILGTYETERIGFARELVATTDRAFRAMAGGGLFSRLMRRAVMPGVVPLAAHSAALRRLIFKTISQIRIDYRHSALSTGPTARIAAGDRMPWVPDDPACALAFDYFGWQLIACGTAPAALDAHAAGVNLPLRTIDLTPQAEQAGLRAAAVYLLRPDGHVGLAMTEYDPAALNDYIDRHALKFDPVPSGV